MSFISQFQYYENGGVAPLNANWGSYQYIHLEDVVKNFMLMYLGNNSLINNEPRYKVIFHAKQAIRELNYDAFKEVKVLELNVCDGLRYVLPSDYVNWVRISLQRDGVLYPLNQNDTEMSSSAYLQDNECNILFDIDGSALSPEYSELDRERITAAPRQIYVNPGHPYDGFYGYLDNGSWYFGGVFGLDTTKANSNPLFRIDKKAGVINFNSEMDGELVVLEYVSDGMENGDDTAVSVNKMFEKYLYASIKFDLLNEKAGVPEYVVNRARKDRRALLANSRIRIGDIHPGRLLNAMRGKSNYQ